MFSLVLLKMTQKEPFTNQYRTEYIKFTNEDKEKGVRVEPDVVRKSYQVQVASFGGNGNDTCTYHYHPTRVMISLTRWHFYFRQKSNSFLFLPFCARWVEMKKAAWIRRVFINFHVYRTGIWIAIIFPFNFASPLLQFFSRPQYRHTNFAFIHAYTYLVSN